MRVPPEIGQNTVRTTFVRRYERCPYGVRTDSGKGLYPSYGCIDAVERLEQHVCEALRAAELATAKTLLAQ
jgi:hypothetical protein